MKTDLEHVCLSTDEMERMILNGTQEAPFSGCRRCWTRYYHTRLFHRILAAELCKPVSPHVRNLVRGLERQETLN